MQVRDKKLQKKRNRKVIHISKRSSNDKLTLKHEEVGKHSQTDSQKTDARAGDDGAEANLRSGSGSQQQQ